jgi:O-antigen/teichoic acid export membrane protein
VNDPPGPILLRALKAALPLYAGTAVVVAAGLVLKVALVVWVFPNDAPSMARFGLLNELLQWTCAVGIFGLSQGVLRLWPERVAERTSIVTTAWLAVLAISVAVTALLQFVTPLREILIGDRIASDLFAPFGWKAPAIGVIAVGAAAFHAAGRFRAKATLEASERIAVTLGSLIGAVANGLPGLLWGSFIASMLVAIGIRPRGGAPSRAVLRDLSAIGAPQLAVSVFETARIFLVLRVMTERGPGEVETGCLATAIGFATPLVVLPEVLAQALYPTMVGTSGERRGLDRQRLRVFAELCAVWIPLLACAGLAAWWLLPAVGDGQYAGAVAPMLALLPGVAAHGLAAHTGYVVLVRGRNAGAAAVSAATLVVASAGAWYAAPRWGATGAAGALSVSLVLRTVLLHLAVRRPETGTLPSLDDVRKTADSSTFPMEVLDGATSAASFFGAAFRGRNDAIHIADARIADVVVIDLDAAKLGEMRAIYPATWRWTVGDAYVVARDMRERGEKADVVVADAWQSDCERMLSELPLWCAIARRYAVVTVAKPWLDAHRLRPDVASLSKWLTERGVAATVESLHRRADWSGGTWWLVLRV